MQLMAAFQRQGGQTRLRTRLIRSLANWHLILSSRQHMTVYRLAVLSPSFREKGCGPGRLKGKGGWGDRGFPVPSFSVWMRGFTLVPLACGC